MALTRDQLNQLYRKRFNRDVDESGYGTYSKFNSPEEVDADLVKSEEYRNLPRNRFTREAQIDPLSEQDYAGFGEQARKMFDPLRTASSNRFAKFREGLSADTRDLQDRLREQAKYDVQGLEENLNSRGLLFSGTNVAGQEAITRDLNKDIRRADIDRAIKEADLVLEEAGFGADLDRRALDTAQQFAEREFSRRTQRADVAKTNLKNLDDIDKFELEKAGLDLSRIKSGSDLLINPVFNDLIIDNPELALQVLRQFGYEV